MIDPIRQVLAELTIEGEYCESAVDAVEKVTTHLFQIVITDWSDQPEASFLLKTARDLKAAHRPLTLAIVSEADRPAALQAGANSVLLKPIRPEQVRDTMRTACELLRAKQQPAGQAMAGQAVTSAHSQPAPAEAPASAEPIQPTATATAAGTSSTSVSLPLSMGHAPEAGFRPGEFLPSAGTGPGSQFDTEKEAEAPQSIDGNAVDPIDALSELEPTAAAVPERSEIAEPANQVTGWAALQARLNTGTRPPMETAKSELLSYSQMTSVKKNSPEPAEISKASQTAEALAEPAASSAQETESEPESVPSDDLSRDEKRAARRKEGSRSGRLMFGALAACLLVTAAIPRTRLRLMQFSRGGMKAVQGWLNPPPPQLPPSVAQHENFGQAGDEYKLPTATPIPDATTDPNQIRVVPVVDPTVKPDKNADANGAQQQPAVVDNAPQDQNQAAPGQSQSPTDAPTNQIAVAKPDVAPTPAISASPSTQPVTPARPVVAPPSRPSPSAPSPLYTVSASTPASIPSSLQTQLAPNAPVAGGAMPPEEAMGAIEPVNLPQLAVLDLLIQHVDPEYPAAAKASGQTGSVVVQIIIGHDGTVQDAKFLQGSLMFARPALDAVRQWRFKPYVMNGRPVSVQSAITMNFQP